MKIGLVSDTHDRVLPALRSALAGVDEILHAGDIASVEALAELETIAPVTAVGGNMDERALKDRLAKKLLLTRGRLRIAMVHGHKVGRASVDDLVDRFDGRELDLVIWGHIHEPVSELRNGIRYFNPGTSGGIGASATCGVLTLDDDEWSVEHVPLG